ncbi:MAG TPA: hypothetical protein VHB02_09210 [Acidimicrobiales bacterium]|nr:hypothetical protein [Acidimicrobiales bacterium]
MQSLRPVAAWVAAVLAAICIPLAVTAHWAHRTLLDNGRYVATLAPLAEDRQFTDRLAVDITAALYRDLPSQLRALPAARSARAAVQGALAHELAQPSFQGIWNRANRRAQKGAVRVFTGSRDHEKVVVELNPVVTTLLDNVDSPVVHPLVPTLDRLVAQHPLQITLLTSAQLVEARDAFANVVDAQWLLGGLAVALAAAALLVAPRRWRVLFGGAACTVATTAAAFVALAIARTVSVSRAAANGADALLSGKVFDILDRYLRQDLWITFGVAAAIAVAVAVGAFVRRRRAGSPPAGPSTSPPGTPPGTPTDSPPDSPSGSGDPSPVAGSV